MVFSIFTELCNRHYKLLLERFHALMKKRRTPSPWGPTFCLWICLFWTFHVNGITQHVFSLLCPAFFTQHVFGVYPRVAWVTASFLFVAEQRPTVRTCHALFTTHRAMGTWLPPAAQPEQRCCEALALSSPGQTPPRCQATWSLRV